MAMFVLARHQNTVNNGTQVDVRFIWLLILTSLCALIAIRTSKVSKCKKKMYLNFVKLYCFGLLLSY